MPLERWKDAAHPEPLLTACAAEHVMGSKIVSAFRVLGPERGMFFLHDGMALFWDDGVLTVAASPEAELDPAVLPAGLREVHGPERLCQGLHRALGGELECSYFMKYVGGPLSGEDPALVPGEPDTVFSILQGSHEFYRTHLRYESWRRETEEKIRLGQTDVWQLSADGAWAGTGALSSRDEECCVLGEIAVLPPYRGRGLGKRITRFLTGRALALGRTPRLMAGYDRVSHMYEALGYETTGRWGELFLC